MVIKNMDNKSLVEKQQVEKAISALRTYITKTHESAKTKNLLDILDLEDVQLQFSYKLVPKIERTKINVVLDHSLVEPTTSICLFVKDLVKVREYEKTIRQYQELFAGRDVPQQIEIFPMKKLKLEYTDYEAKRNLSNAYDKFLCDARITRLLPAILGKHFIGKKRFPLQVRLDAKDLKKEFHTALHTSTCDLSGRGSSCQMTVGNLTQSDAELVDNIITSITALCLGIPGGSDNIRNLVLKTANSKALPLYLSLGSKADVELPKIRRTKEVALEEDVTTVLNAKVSVDSRGVVRITNKSKKISSVIQKVDVSNSEDIEMSNERAAKTASAKKNTNSETNSPKQNKKDSKKKNILEEKHTLKEDKKKVTSIKNKTEEKTTLKKDKKVKDLSVTTKKKVTTKKVLDADVVVEKSNKRRKLV